MHVAHTQTALWKIMLAFAHAYQVAQVIHCWAVFQFNIVQLTINVHREPFAKPEFVQQFVQRIVNVSTINFAYKEFVNRLVTTIPLALSSNSVKTIFVHKKFDAELMTIAH